MAQFKSIPDFKMLNQYNDTITRGDMYGKIWVIDFFFTSCPSICPEMTENLKQLSEAFIDEPRFGILSISIDPERDTPERMRSYAAKYEVEHPFWYFLTGDKAQIMELANQGFNLYAAENPNAPGGFEHSGKFALFDDKVMMRSRYDNFGNPILFYDGVNDPHTPEEVQYDVKILIEDVKQLLKETDR
ncbi:MAG: SCO family protein [Flavobacteriaceae bacterium]|nr:SCO family protein [Flavobacteriaceae bacterium]